MTRQIQAINVCSQLNDWIDFVIVLENQEEADQAEEIINKAADDWFENSDGLCDTISEFICDKLRAETIQFDIYYKENIEDDE